MSDLPAPAVCPICRSPVVYTTNDALYGRQYGEWPYLYLCTNEACRASVGVHPGTTIPLGIMADRATSKARVLAHDAFDPLWRNGPMSRTQAYAWLAETLNIPVEECHIGMMDRETCGRVIALCIMAAA